MLYAYRQRSFTLARSGAKFLSSAGCSQSAVGGLNPAANEQYNTSQQHRGVGVFVSNHSAMARRQRPMSLLPALLWAVSANEKHAAAITSPTHSATTTAGFVSAHHCTRGKTTTTTRSFPSWTWTGRSPHTCGVTHSVSRTASGITTMAAQPTGPRIRNRNSPHFGHSAACSDTTRVTTGAGFFPPHPTRYDISLVGGLSATAVEVQDVMPVEKVAGGRVESVEDEDKVREVTKSVLLGLFGEVRRS